MQTWPYTINMMLVSINENDWHWIIIIFCIIFTEGKPCAADASSEVRPCNSHECGTATYCAWNQWTDWSECSAECGNGERHRRRSLQLLGSKPEEKKDILTTTVYDEVGTSLQQVHLSQLYSTTDSVDGTSSLYSESSTKATAALNTIAIDETTVHGDGGKEVAKTEAEAASGNSNGGLFGTWTLDGVVNENFTIPQLMFTFVSGLLTAGFALLIGHRVVRFWSSSSSSGSRQSYGYSEQHEEELFTNPGTPQNLTRPLTEADHVE